MKVSTHWNSFRSNFALVLQSSLSLNMYYYLRMMSLFWFVCANLSLSLGYGQAIIPAPVNYLAGTGSFQIASATPITITPANHPELQVTATYLATFVGQYNAVEKSAPKRVELIVTDINLPSPEAYKLTVNSNFIRIESNTPQGVFYGVQTFLQLLPPKAEAQRGLTGETNIPACTIVDNPRFRWRGVHLDVSRHFFTKQEVKTFIDQIARYKFNRLHLHLSDDHGWRLEIKSYPKLTSVGAWRVPRYGTFGSYELAKPEEKATDGGFYTQDDMREIIQHAKSRYIEIMPEIDVPGHSMAAIAAYPELCVTRDSTIRVNPGTSFSKWYGNGKFDLTIDNSLNPIDENVYVFLDKVFGEVAALFPFEYIHMGGDECYKGYWEKDPKVKAFMQKNNIKSGEELQAYFNRRVHKIITSKGKMMMGWDEILEGGKVEGAAVMSWRGVKGGIEATRDKHFVVMSPASEFYLDMMQGDPSIEVKVYGTSRLTDVYHMDILPKGIDSTYVLGGQGNLWTEQIPTRQQLEYMAFPRVCALAENLWSPKSKRSFSDFTNRVEHHFERLSARKVNYSPSMYDPIISVKKASTGQLEIELKPEAQNLDIYFTLDNTIPTPYHTRYTAPVKLPPGTDMLRVASFREGKQMGRLISLSYDDLVKRVRK